MIDPNLTVDAILAKLSTSYGVEVRAVLLGPPSAGCHESLTVVAKKRGEMKRLKAYVTDALARVGAGQSRGLALVISEDLGWEWGLPETRLKAWPRAVCACEITPAGVSPLLPETQMNAVYEDVTGIMFVDFAKWMRGEDGINRTIDEESALLGVVAQ